MAGHRLLLLIDGNALVHRAFHALPPLTVNRTGEMVNAVYGFANTLFRVLADQKPTHWAIAFDYPAPTFRHEMYAEYKAQRPATPEELKGQIGRVHELVDALSMPSFEVKGYEADDILGALSEQATEAGIDVAILTGDRDLLQLVRSGVKVLLPGRTFSEAQPYDEGAVRERFGVRPDQFAVYKALVGDASDNIPGVTGVGEKTAVKLVSQYKDIEGIYSHISELPPKVGATLSTSRRQVEQSKDLATILTNAPVSLRIEDCVIGDYDPEQVQALFKQLEFTRLLGRLPPTTTGPAKPESAAATPVTESRAVVVKSEADQQEAVRRLKGSRELVVSLYVDGAGAPRSRRSGQSASIVRGLAVSTEDDATWYVPIEASPNGPAAQLSLEQPLEFLRPVLENEAIGKTCDEAKPVVRFLSSRHIALRGLRFDTSIAAHLAGEKSVTLAALAFNRLGLTLADGPTSDAVVTDEGLARWLAERARACRLLRENLNVDIDEKDMTELFRDVELPLVFVLARMEENGILLDTAVLHVMDVQMSQDIARLEAAIYDGVGHRFNLNSPQQLGNVLFQELGLRGGKKTKSGYSTEAALLESLRAANPVIDLILQYRQLTKLKSTYVDTLPRLVEPHGGRVHTLFTQTGTATGRISSSEPNLQNLPIRTEQGRMIRQAVVAPPGSMLLSADYSQIDLRVLAHLSQDEGLLKAFQLDEDIHNATASTVFHVAAEEVTPEMRRAAKVVNFGIVYGMSDYGLEQATSFSRAEASGFIRAYFEQYPGVCRWLEETKAFARTNGYVKTLLGRRRPIPEIVSRNRQIREAAERMAINAPVQGTSADIVKLAMLHIEEALDEGRFATRMLLQIHDELLFEVPNAEQERIEELVRRLMRHAIELSIPLKVELKVGPNWSEMWPCA